MCRLQWYITVTLLSLTSALRCPEGMGCGPCQELPDNEYEIHCATSDSDSDFEVRFKPNEWVRIDCYNYPNWTEFHLGTIQQILHTKSISFRRCKLPEREKLGAIARQIVANNVEELIFQSRGDLTLSLTKNTFAEFKSVKTLTLSSNGLKNVTADLLDNLKNLKILNLRDNHLRELPRDFLNLPNLRSIELGGNDLEVIESTVFDKSTKLQLLNIWNNKLVEIKPNSFDKLELLESLDLHMNELTSLPENIFAKLSNLKTINLSQNNFTGDSLSVNLLRNNHLLQLVTFFENKQNLTTLPSKFFGNLKNLTIVKMRRSGLVRLPEDLFVGASGLRNLSLERNYIEEIPRGLFNDCGNLGTLDLGFNELRDLPEGIFRMLNKLEILDLSRNHIMMISEDMFEGLSSLQVLNMENNGLKTIDANGLSPLDNLRIVKFSFNQLTLKSINTRFDDDFGLKSPLHNCMTTIEEIHLAHNNITDIFGDWIWATGLRILDLSYNNFRFLEVDDLVFVSNSIEVDLSSNKIEKILLQTAEIFTQMQTIQKNTLVSIEDNPITCDCDLYDLLRYREGRMHPSVNDQFYLKMNDLKCHKPNYLENIPLDQLNSESLKCLVDDPVIYNATCPDSCDCWIRPENRAYVVDCSHRNLPTAPKHLKSPEGLHIELNLSSNSLTMMPSMYQSGYNAVTVLSLSNNQITELPLSGLSRNLQLLDLESNSLSRLEPQVMDFLINSTRLKNLTLQGNPWTADCNSRDFLSFIQMKMVTIPELQKVTFNSLDLPVFEMTREELCPPVIGWVIGVCIGFAILGVIIGGLAAIYYRYQHEIKVWLYAKQWCLWWVSEDEVDKDKLYDAFVSYSHKDEEFVVNELIKTLESGPKPFKIHYHRRWTPGTMIPAQIAQSIEDSRRTIVVLSPDFLDSVWGKMEFTTAHTQALSEGRARVIVILYRDIGPIDQLEPELRAYLSMNTYIKWGDPWFWERLRYAMPHHEEFIEKKRKPTVFESQQINIEIIREKVGVTADVENSKIEV